MRTTEELQELINIIRDSEEDLARAKFGKSVKSVFEVYLDVAKKIDKIYEVRYESKSQ
jgi:hypothetical protein